MPSKPAGNSGSTQSVTTQNKVELPDWVNQAASDLWGQAQNLGYTPGGVKALPQYQVAPITPGGQQDIGGMQALVGSTQPNFLAAQGGAQTGMNYMPQQVTPQSLGSTDLSPYMNPYTQDVIDKTMPLMDQSRQAANNQTADLAAKTGAFGGSRQGVAEGVNNAQSGLYTGQMGALLNQANFNQAQGAAQKDITNNLAGQQSNQTAGLQGANLNLTGSQQLGNLTAQGQTASLQSLLAAMGGQTTLQGQTQAEMDAPSQDALRRLQLQSSTLSGLPYGQTNTSTQTGPGPVSNPWLTGLGALGTGAGIIGSIAPLFAGSDRSLKTDIKKIGKDEETDLPLYTYRYKDDPKTYPKVVGIMAQDAQKKYPGEVVEIGGKLAVRSSFLTGIMERANGNA